MAEGRKGICFLVGAGPGDPGLLTLRGRACLESADVVVYDSLCNPELLELAPSTAERIHAGKRAGVHTLKQEEINSLLVEKTRSGASVVRLKGGDPFVFGRGGEEAEALAEAGLPFEIVPGVSSAIAGPAYAGIPVTHRSHNAVLTLFTGHEDPAKPGTSIDYKALAGTPGTKVMLMGTERIAIIASELVAAGMARSTPIALIRWATTGSQKTLTSDLGNIAQRVEETGFRAPAVAVIGQVVALREQLNWFESKPLFGTRIAVTRTRRQAGTLVHALRRLGADAFELPTIRIEPAPNKVLFREVVRDAHTYDWIVFTSANGVEAFFETFYQIYRDARELGGARIAAIGPATAEKVRLYRFDVDLQPDKFTAEETIRAFKSQTSLENLKMLLPRAEGAREVLATELGQLGAIIDDIPAYRTVPETRDIAGGIARFRESGADIITFTSSSTVENFVALKLPLSEGLKMASIGPITSATMRSAGLDIDIEATQHNIPGLVQAILAHCSRKDQTARRS